MLHPLTPRDPVLGTGLTGVPDQPRLEGDALGLSIPPWGGATAWFEASPLAGPMGTCPRWG